MTEDFEPLVKVKLEVLLGRGAKKPAAPATASTMRYGTSDGTAGGEEEEVDMWVDLADDAEIDVEVSVESLEWDVRSQAPIFPFMAERIWSERAIAGFHHKHDRVKDPRDSGGGEYGGPYHTVRSRKIL